MRKALHDFTGWYLSRLPAVALSPYLPMLTLQIASGLSHIFPAIRLDTCRIVLLLLEQHADGLIGTWPSRPPSTNTLVGTSTVFDGLRLAAGLGEEKGNAGYRLSGANKLVILRTLRTFISHALERDSGSKSDKAILGQWTLHNLDVLPADEQFSLGVYDWALEWRDPLRADASGEGAGAELESTYTALHSLLLSTFMESAPSAFAPSGSSDETALSLCAECAELVRLFANALLTSYGPPDPAVRALFGDFLKRMTGWFPFDKRPASPAADTLFALSLNYARLATLLAPAPPKVVPKREGWRARVRAIEAAWATMRPSAPSGERGKKEGGRKANDAALAAAADWVVDALTPSSDALAPQLPAQGYADLLPVVWSLLLLPPDGETSMLEALVSATLKQGGATAKRRASDALLMKVVRTHEDAFSRDPLFVPLSSPARSLMAQWIGSIPRTLWELGNRDAQASAALLHFLLEVSPSRRRFEAPYSLVAVDGALAGKLAPFFHLVHPSRGAMEGPWAQLPAQEQRLALDVARVWAAEDASGRLANAVARAVGGQSAPGWGRAYWERA